MSAGRHERWHEIVRLLREHLEGSSEPSVSTVAADYQDPFRILISTVISLRTKDEVTTEASARLFSRAAAPRDLVAVSAEEIARLIYPAGFYNTKARSIHEIARTIADRFGGSVPRTREELLALPGVGRKTANLVLGLGFGIPAICVDTHVHRIPNRLGLVETTTPEQTEQALEESLPHEYWIEINGLLVRFGQRVCTPVSPWCSRCPLSGLCPRVGVQRSR
jgi:endonuclease III